MGLFDKLFGGGKKSNHFLPSAELMPEDKFWKIIKTTFDNSFGEFEQQQEELKKELTKLTLQDIILFDNRFKELHGKAYNWELWGAIFVVHGGCSDDGFTDFRDWLIAQGQEIYNRTLADPDTLVDLEQDKIDIDWEGMGYVPTTVFKELTGQDIPSNFEENQELTGKEWKEEGDDLKTVFPKLYAKYADNL